MNHSGPQPMDDERPEPGISLSQHDGEKKEEAIHGNITHSEVGDVGLPVVDELAANQVPPEEYRKVLRKIDKHLMPMLCLIYGIQFLDKTSLANASIMGLRQDLKLSASQFSTILASAVCHTHCQYSWTASIFYLGYLVWEYPAVILLQKLPMGKLTGVNIIVWGAILTCTAACKSFSHIMVVRFFLGALESSVTPAFTFYTARWYLSKEQGARTGIWFSFNGLSSVLGAVIAYGFARADQAGKLALPGWQVIYLVLGLLTVAMGILFTIVMPDTPLKAWFLDERQRKVAVLRIKPNQQGIGNTPFKIDQLKEAFVDPMTWLYFLYGILVNIPNGALTNFSAILINGLGYTAVESLLLTGPLGAVACVFVLVSLYLGDKTNNRIAAGLFSLTIGIIGVLLLWLLPHTNLTGRLTGIYFSNAATVGFVVILSLITSNVAGSTKKSTVSALFLMAYCAGNLIGPQTFRGKDAPTYTPALIIIVACLVASFGILAAILAMNTARNKRQIAICQSLDYVSNPDQAFMDLTDLQNPEFRYRL